MCIKNQPNALNSTDVFLSLLCYFRVRVSVGNPAIFMVTFVLQEYIVVKCVRLAHNIEIHMNIG